MGGTAEGTDRVRAAGWPAMLCFLCESLGGRAQQ
jgi:hypothetical protein